MVETWLPLFGGLTLLLVGGELLVRGAVLVARRLGVSPLVIGLTLVGFGTSTPELVTSIQAALVGSPGIAYGNIVGSNIANILLIVGVSAVLSPIVVASSTIRRDGYLMLAATAIFAALALAMPMSRVVGLCLVTTLLVYLFAIVRGELAGSKPDDHGAVFDKATALHDADPLLSKVNGRSSLVLSLAMTVAGLALVIGGGAVLVNGAVSLARTFGISEVVIGLTIVAIGTSMPELITSTVAALKRQGDIAFGNVIGSNIYNILGVGGTTAVIAPSEVPTAIAHFDNPVMVVVSIVLLVFAMTRRRIARWEGAFLLSGYAVYVSWIWPA